MRRVSYLFAAAAIGGLALAATPSSASPLANGLATGNTTLPTVNDGLVQKVHSWHCRKRYSKRLGWHRHRRACYDDDYSYGYGYGAPFLSFGFGFGDFDDGHRHRGFKHRHRGFKKWKKRGGKKGWKD